MQLLQERQPVGGAGEEGPGQRKGGHPAKKTKKRLASAGTACLGCAALGWTHVRTVTFASCDRTAVVAAVCRKEALVASSRCSSEPIPLANFLVAAGAAAAAVVAAAKAPLPSAFRFLAGLAASLMPFWYLAEVRTCTGGACWEARYGQCARSTAVMI